jgi:hypothetical protein
MFGLAFLLLPPCPSPGQDLDGDKVSDCVELRTGTDPLSADSDEDGVPDGVEDANQDGHVDEGESDPREPGLFPGSAPHIPEPLSFDLVRGLGAKRGELEVNTLFEAAVGETPHWAPEVEWAFAEGAAIELELPIVGDRLEAIKFAGQYTLPRRRQNSFIQGFQQIVEVPLTGQGTELSSLYIAGARFNPVLSGMWMVGTRVTVEPGVPVEVLSNLSIFADAGERATVGLETNLAVGLDAVDLLLLPQLHLQIGRRFALQFGAGVVWNSREGGRVIFAMRPILE